MALTVQAGQGLSLHSHAWPQLLLVESGALRIRIPEGTWVLPSSLAGWLPPDADHALTAIGPARVHTLYLAPSRIDAGKLRVLQPSDLLRALVREVCSRGNLWRERREDCHLVAVLLDQIAAAGSTPMRIDMPRDVRALRVAERVLAAPSLSARLSDLARGSGAAPRTLERLFVAETGMSFARWRRQACLLDAVQRLCSGAGVSEVANELGYSSPSAFISMFRTSLGVTPARFARES